MRNICWIYWWNWWNLKKSNFVKIWIDELHITNLTEKLKQYSKEDINSLQSSFIYKGHYGKMSSILPILNKNYSYLKSVKIYTTHSFIFDVDFKLPKERYETHSPDLIVISPIVKFENNIKIDLSCDRIPDFPDGIEKADQGDPDKDDKPGLPGYNGGNLLISADEILNKHRFRFISQGAQGGPG